MLDIYQLLDQCAPDVEPTTMLRVIGVESSQRLTAIGYKITKGKSVMTLVKQPSSLDEAISWATWLLANGYKFDAGISQINSVNFSKFGVTPENVDGCKNVNTGSRILLGFYQQAIKKYGEGQDALRAAISAYQSGNFFTGYATGYVSKVISQKIPERKHPALMPPLEPSTEVVETISLESYQQQELPHQPLQ